MGWGNVSTFLVQIIVVVPGKFNIAKKEKKLSYDRAIDIYLRVKERNVSGLV
jgi:hypothetical protein